MCAVPECLAVKFYSIWSCLCCLVKVWWDSASKWTREIQRERETHCGKRIRCVCACMCQPVKMRNHTEYSLSEWSRSICVMRTSLPRLSVSVRQWRKWERQRLTSNYRSVSLVMLWGRSFSDFAADPSPPLARTLLSSRPCECTPQKQEVRDSPRPWKKVWHHWSRLLHLPWVAFLPD